MKKKRVKLKKPKINITSFIAMSFVAVLMMLSVGFSAMSTSLSINGKAAFMPVGMIRVMSISQDNLIDADENSKSINVDSISVNVDINELSGSASYNVVIKNLGETNKQLVSIDDDIFSNDDMEYQLIGFNIDDVINARDEVTFKVVFKYKNGVSNITETRLNTKLIFRFEDYIPIDQPAYFKPYNGLESLFGMDKTGIVSFSRNTTLTQEEVLAKNGVTLIHNESNDEYNSNLPVYGWIEDNNFYWWSQAEKVYFHPDTLKAFAEFGSIVSVDLTGTSTEKMKNFAHFFDKDRLLVTIIGKIDTSGLVLENTSFNFASDNNENASSEKGLSYMFNDCNALTTVDLSAIDTTNAIDLKRMFGGCKKLGNIDISHFDTSNAKSMYWMFRNCTAMTEIDLSNFNTRNVQNFNGMFLSCTKLKTITFGDDFDTSSAVVMKQILA